MAVGSVSVGAAGMRRRALVTLSCFCFQLRAVHEQLAALSQGPVSKPKKKRDRKEKRKKKKAEKRKGKGADEEARAHQALLKKSKKAAGSSSSK